MEIPTTTFHGVLKQVDTSRLSDENREILQLCFPEFFYESDRMAPYKEQGINVVLTAYQPRFTDWGRLRRYAGSISLSPGRYYSVCINEDGDDGGTLLNELMSYWSRATMLYPSPNDSTLLPPEERNKFPEIKDNPTLGLQISQFNFRKRFLKKPVVEESEPAYYPIPLTVSKVEISNVLDLRIPETQKWFFKKFTKLEEGIGLEGHKLSDDGPSIMTFKYHKPENFYGLLPTLVVPGPGGSTFHQAVGAWLRSHGVSGLVFPSARCNVFWQLLGKEGNKNKKYAISFSGWNFVDYRNSGPADWKSLFGYLSTWVLPQKAGIMIDKIKGDQPGWTIKGAEEGEHNRVEVELDLMKGKIDQAPDWNPKAGYRRPYYSEQG